MTTSTQPQRNEFSALALSLACTAILAGVIFYFIWDGAFKILTGWASMTNAQAIATLVVVGSLAGAYFVSRIFFKIRPNFGYGETGARIAVYLTHVLAFMFGIFLHCSFSIFLRG